MKVTIWRVEFCHSSIGVYDYQWFATEAEANQFVQSQVDDEDYLLVEYSTGAELTISTPEAVDVELTLDGLLSFANEYAVDTGAC